jgi:hypothetical protein
MTIIHVYSCGVEEMERWGRGRGMSGCMCQRVGVVAPGERRDIEAAAAPVPAESCASAAAARPN